MYGELVAFDALEELTLDIVRPAVNYFHLHFVSWLGFIVTVSIPLLIFWPMIADFFWLFLSVFCLLARVVVARFATCVILLMAFILVTILTVLSFFFSL